MLVGTKDIQLDSLKAACRSPESLIEYACNLVPTPLRHIPAIVSNQRYYTALLVRSSTPFTWDRKHELCEALLKGVKIKGIPNTLYDYQDILVAIDVEAFERYLKEDADAER